MSKKTLTVSSFWAATGFSTGVEPTLVELSSDIPSDPIGKGVVEQMRAVNDSNAEVNVKEVEVRLKFTDLGVMPEDYAPTIKGKLVSAEQVAAAVEIAFKRGHAIGSVFDVVAGVDRAPTADEAWTRVKGVILSAEGLQVETEPRPETGPLPVNAHARSLIKDLWADGADGLDVILGILGAVREVAVKEGEGEVERLAEAFLFNESPP